MIRSILVLVLCLFTASASFAAHETAVVSASLELEGASTSASATFFTAAIVSCPMNKFKNYLDLLEDRICRRGPHERS
jgi:hypothetical protein